MTRSRLTKAPACHLVTLGCPKNQVDGESMAAVLSAAGYRVVAEPRRADVIVVNTCGFIAAAEEESREAIRGLASRKRPGQLLVVAGCMAERRGAPLAAAYPGIDGVLGTHRWGEITALLEALRRGEPSYWLGEGRELPTVRRAVSGASAYLKISDGCDVGCAFCTIPLFKGRHRSKPADQVVAEARDLVGQGIREIVLIGQDTTAYGVERGERDALADLVERLCREVPELPWIRLMYGFPGRITPRLLDVMAREPQVVKYLDLPLQHASREVLARMDRPRQDLREVVARLRAGVPGIAIRSAFIVGYPGETEAEFGELLSFLEDAQLDRVGVFKYSAEEGTKAAALPNQIPESVKERRFARAMELQQRISLAKNRSLIGARLPVLVEGRVVQGPDSAEVPFKSVGRSHRDAPEVDGLVLVKEDVPEGSIVSVRITEAMEYDLIGEVVG